ncbi:MAG: hypothetical protein JJT94_03615 [Bernardetiaceae bacterium]|nr:hypothetical protein [Bernardetiaceae bacterium]
MWKHYFTQPHLSVRLSTLQHIPLDVKQPYTIVAKAKNQIAIEALEEEKIKLMDFLRENLKNPHLELEIILKPEKPKTPKKVYTPEEQLEKLSQEYPVIQELKQRLDLDAI